MFQSCNNTYTCRLYFTAGQRLQTINLHKSTLTKENQYLYKGCSSSKTVKSFFSIVHECKLQILRANDKETNSRISHFIGLIIKNDFFLEIFCSAPHSFRMCKCSLDLFSVVRFNLHYDWNKYNFGKVHPERSALQYFCRSLWDKWGHNHLCREY